MPVTQLAGHCSLRNSPNDSNAAGVVSGEARPPGGSSPDAALLAGWRLRVERARQALNWPPAAAVARSHAQGTSLAIAAPFDVLLTATEINEWALTAALAALNPGTEGALEAALVATQPDDEPAPVLAEPPALLRFAELARREARPHLRELAAAALALDLAAVIDDTVATIGLGAGARSWPLDALPEPRDVTWPALHNVPVALVTGSNGKTTTVRLVAACAVAHGWSTGYNCTDDLCVGARTLDRGDYSGPLGARTILREPAVEAAVLEAARGGILRRGLAVERADVAVITNLSADHFGEYGIHDLERLADVKLVVARPVRSQGLVALNANDAVLRSRSAALERPIGWFALDADHDVLVRHRAGDGATCGVRDGRLILTFAGGDHDLGEVRDMPLTVAASATYNIANVAAAALAATAPGIAPQTVAAVLAGFGANPGDNPGRLMHFALGGVHIVVDYAHNPDGLRGIAVVAAHLRTDGRVALLLGQAGNHTDADIERLAATAAAIAPDLIVVKEMEGYLRNREAGEVSRIIHAALLRNGVAPARLTTRPSEFQAARCAFEWARAGDVLLLLLLHSLPARAQVLALLERLERSHWSPGAELPL
jgi:UDP-N-acetylmuramyl tripeptide synthase